VENVLWGKNLRSDRHPDSKLEGGVGVWATTWRANEVPRERSWNNKTEERGIYRYDSYKKKRKEHHKSCSVGGERGNGGG